MSFKEKTAWIMAGILLGLGAFYAHAVYRAGTAIGAVPPPDKGLITLATIVLVAGAIVAHIVAAAMAPDEADAPEDERDRLVEWRAGNVSGWVLGFGVFAGLWHYVFQGDGNLMFHICVGSLIIAQIAEYGLSILYYRRGV